MAIYYVKTGGNNTLAGTSDATAFATLEHAHSRSDVTTIRVHRDYSQVGFTPQKAGTVGSPIVFEPYGTGTTNKPTITGKKKLEGWTSIGDGLYKVTDTGFLDRVKFLLVDGIQSTVATWPRNQTYNRITGGSGNATGTLTDSVNLSGNNFTGGEVVVKKLAWTIDTMQITNQSGSILTFSGGSSTYNLTVGWGYFVQNHRDCCTQVGDWCQEGKDIVMYFGENNPDDYEIYAPYLERVIFNNRGNNQFHGFRFEMFNGGSDNLSHLPCFFTSNSPNLHFIDTEFEYMGNTVFYHEAVNCSGFTIKGGSAKNCLNIFYWNRYSSSTPIFTIENFNIENVGHIKGAGGNGSVAYSGIVFSSGTNGGLLRNVRLNNIGYNGISFNGYEFLVDNCRVENACIHKNDGGAYYSFGLGDEGKSFDITKRVLDGDIAINCLGSNDGHSSYWTDGPRIGAVEGYYLDDVVRKLTVRNCIAINCRTGIKIHNNYDLLIQNNYFLLNQNAQTLWASDNLVAFPIRNIQYTGNVNYALSYQLVVRIDNKNSDEAQFGTIDGNYYFKQGGGTIFNITKTGSGANVKNQTLAQWSTQYGHDENSNEIPTLAPEYEIPLNDSVETIEYTPYRRRINKDGNEVNAEFYLLPFEVKLLLDDLGPIEDEPIPPTQPDPNTRPNLSILTPANNSEFEIGESIDFLVNTFDVDTPEYPLHKVDQLDLYYGVDPIELRSDPIQGDNLFTWNNAQVGSYIITAVATDTLGGITSRTINISVVNSNPPPVTYDIEVIQTPGGTVTGGGEFNDGDEVVLTAIPNTGWDFIKWSDETNENPYVFNATGSMMISAIFQPIPDPEPVVIVVKGKFRIV